jgi:dienelactone hydrolase
MRRSLLALLVLLSALTGVGSGRLEARPAARPPTGSWTGSYTLGNGAAVAVAVRMSGNRALVALGAGHADAQGVAVAARPRIRFALPGRPSPLVFDGTVRGRRLAGTTRQGAARGGFTLARGVTPALFARGYFASGGTRLAFVDDPYGVPRLVDLESGMLHGVFGAGPAFQLGAGWSTLVPAFGAATVDAAAATVEGTRAPRIAVRQLEVRFPSGRAALAGTLTIPAGPGRHAAVVFVTGSGTTQRAYLPDLQALLVESGVAVLAYDKRGVAQSGGRYPGESPTDGTIDILASDAQAAVRWLARQPGIDPAKVGLAGHSQAGWIIPRAASREPAVRFAVEFAGPAVTADENDHFQNLTGQGERPPQLSDDEIDAEVLRQGPGGVDPIPWIRSLRIPVLWLYGGLDRHIPTRLSVRRLDPLRAEAGRDFTIAVFPNANHALVETQTGLTAEMLRSDRFAPGLFATVRAWLRARVSGA